MTQRGSLSSLDLFRTQPSFVRRISRLAPDQYISEYPALKGGGRLANAGNSAPSRKNYGLP